MVNMQFNYTINFCKIAFKYFKHVQFLRIVDPLVSFRHFPDGNVFNGWWVILGGKL